MPTLVHTTGNGVLMIDPGPHAWWGHHLIAAIRHTTAEPIHWAVDTYAHPKHMLANAAFAQLQSCPAPLASATTVDLMRQRCETYLARLTTVPGARVIHEMEIVYLEPALRDGDWLHTDKTAWQVHVCAVVHNISGTVPYAPQRGVLCIGDLVYLQRIPDLQDGSLARWRQVLHALVRLPTNVVVDTIIGAPAQMLWPTLTHFDMLNSMVTRIIEGGDDTVHVLAYVPGDAYRDWRNFHPRHALNAGYAWREFEDRWMRSVSGVWSQLLHDWTNGRHVLYQLSHHATPHAKSPVPTNVN